MGYPNLLKKKSRPIYRGKHFFDKKNRTRGSLSVWDQVAAWYDALVGDGGNDYQKEVVLPGAWRLLELRESDSALDIACGQGVFCRYLHERKIKVEGLDVSEVLTRFSIRRSSKKINFHIADAADSQALLGKKYNGISCLLAIQNMPDLKAVFRNVARWLKPEGKFVFVTTHPCFRIPRQTHWGWDEEKKTQYRRIDHYASSIDIPILAPPMAHSKTFTITYHRSLQVYFKALKTAGLYVDGLEEWTSHKSSHPGKRSRAENRARKEIPMFLAVRARVLAKE